MDGIYSELDGDIIYYVNSWIRTVGVVDFEFLTKGRNSTYFSAFMLSGEQFYQENVPKFFGLLKFLDSGKEKENVKPDIIIICIGNNLQYMLLWYRVQICWIPRVISSCQTWDERVRVRRSSSKSSRFLFEFEFESNEMFEFEFEVRVFSTFFNAF